MTVNTHHAPIYHEAGVQVDQPQQLVHALRALFKPLGMKGTMGGEDACTASRGCRMNMIVPAGGRRDSSNRDYRDKALLIDMIHATINGSAAENLRDAQKNT